METTALYDILNIETLGHVDHGKTSLTKAITGIWADKHSESIKRNMTIKLGYADATIRKCPKCNIYTTKNTCEACGVETEPVLKIAMLDAPGHETLMATAIAGASIIDAAIFVIAANEPCPMPQTKEHMMIIKLLGIKNVIIVQTKIDIVGRDAAIKHYNQIKEFIKGSPIENAPIIPVVATLGINIDVLLEKIVELPRPKRDIDSDPIMYTIRSFDINKPGKKIESLSGGVLGGIILRGKFKVKDEIEIRPGINISIPGKHDSIYKPALTTIESISSGSENLTEAYAGNMVGLSTNIDPSFVKADNMVGNLVGHVNRLPEVKKNIRIKYFSINRDDVPSKGFADGETLILGIGTATSVGRITSIKKSNLDIALTYPVCMEASAKIAILRNISNRWKLVGYGIPA
ncbi:MAG: translation initiation factor IF-2 subunit gamma [Candidatus Micrarchaeaceae archaeon]